MDRLHKHHISFKHAWEGLTWALTTQPNFLIHAILSVLSLMAGLILKISFIEMIIIIFCIILGFTVEMLNTAVECVTDLITSEWKKEAKRAKDVAAGMMLLTAIGTASIALIIFIAHL